MLPLNAVKYYVKISMRKCKIVTCKIYTSINCIWFSLNSIFEIGAGAPWMAMHSFVRRMTMDDGTSDSEKRPLVFHVNDARGTSDMRF